MTLDQFSPHPGQQQVLDSDKRFIATVSGVQGGKTTVGAIWLLREIYKDYEAGIVGDYLVAAPTYKILQQSTLVKFQDLIPADWGKLKEQKQVFELSWGSRIFLRSADSPDSLEGMTLRAAWVDEAGQMNARVWTVLQARVAISRGRVLMTSTPYAQNFYYRDIYKKAGKVNGELQPNGDPDIEVISWGSVDNPAFSKEEQDRAKASMNEALYERRYCGKFTQLEGLVYTITEGTIIDPFDVPQTWKRFGGMDFGKADPTAILDIAEDPVNHIFYVVGEYYRSNGLLKDMAEWISGRPMQRILADPQSAQLISELRLAHGLGQVQPADKQEIMVGIERLQALFNEGRLKIFSTCKNVIEELSVYCFAAPDPDKVQKDLPIDKNNHAMDALRYAFNKPMDGLWQKRQENIKESRKRYTPLVTRTNWQSGLNSVTGY